MSVKEEVKVMSKQEAIEEVRKVFKGNKRFISNCEIMIASTSDFIGITSTDIQKDSWNWEKYFRLTIQFGYYSKDGIYRDFGYKSICYRKGNKKYGPENTRIGKNNVTSNIHDFIITVYGVESSEEYTWDA